MKDRIVVDTNIFIGAWFEENEICQKVLELIYDREILLLFSQETIGELVYVTKNFARYTFDADEEIITFMCHLMDIFYHSHSIKTIEREEVFEFKSKDEYDDMLIKCAFYGNANFLLTDDRNNGMLKIGQIEGTKIITPEMYVNSLRFRK